MSHSDKTHSRYSVYIWSCSSTKGTDTLYVDTCLQHHCRSMFISVYYIFYQQVMNYLIYHNFFVNITIGYEPFNISLCTFNIQHCLKIRIIGHDTVFNIQWFCYSWVNMTFSPVFHTLHFLSVLPPVSYVMWDTHCFSLINITTVKFIQDKIQMVK